MILAFLTFSGRLPVQLANLAEAFPSHLIVDNFSVKFHAFAALSAIPHAVGSHPLHIALSPSLLLTFAFIPSWNLVVKQRGRTTVFVVFNDPYGKASKGFV